MTRETSPSTAASESAPLHVPTELERLHARCFGWAMQCSGYDRLEAEDVLHTAYLRILDGTARFAGASSFRTWVFGVVRHTAQERRRRAAVRAVLTAHWGALRAHTREDVVDPRTASHPTRALRNALARLPARQREVLHLVYYQDLSIQEAAGVLEIGLGSARTHYERGKAKLRALLTEGE